MNLNCVVRFYQVNVFNIDDRHPLRALESLIYEYILLISYLSIFPSFILISALIS